MDKVFSWYKNREHILQYVSDIKSIEELDELAKEEPDGRCGLIPRGGLSHARKGLDRLINASDAIRLKLHDVLFRPCEFCGRALGCGLDRLFSEESYAISLLKGHLVSCCAQCNVIWLNRPRDAVLIHIVRIYKHMFNTDRLKTLDQREKDLYQIFTSADDADNSLTWMHSDQQPVATIIGGQRILVPSRKVLLRFRVGRGQGQDKLEVTNVPISDFHSWQDKQNAESLRKIRLALGITTSCSERITHTDEEMTLLIQIDEMAAEDDQTATTRTNQSNSWRSAALASRNESDDEEDSDSSDDENSLSSGDDDCLLDSFFENHSRESRASIFTRPFDASIDGLELDDTRRRRKRHNRWTHDCRVKTCDTRALSKKEFHGMCHRHKTLFEKEDPEEKSIKWRIKEKKKDTSIVGLELDDRGDLIRGGRSPIYSCRVKTCDSQANNLRRYHGMCTHHKNLFEKEDATEKSIKWRILHSKQRTHLRKEKK